MDNNAVLKMYDLFHRANADPDLAPAVTYDAGFIVLSFFTSLVGCITTLELLQRRTSTHGAFNWFLLAAAAITMGGIGIWGMHFVGNRAIVLDNANPSRQILYSPGFTAISFFLPIVVLLFAFYTLGIPTRARQLNVTIAGFFTGTAVCGMHFLGQYSVENYFCSYKVANVVGSAIIAVVASFTALSIFFRLRDTWTDSWWKRAFCGAILATAVSGMHWTAAAGTRYHWKGDLSSHGNSRSQTAIIAAVLSMGACVLLLTVAFIRGRNRRVAKRKSQRLVLACAYFDEAGQLMVTQDGTLPSEKITNHYVEKTFGEDDLSRSHPTYQWIFQASRNWPVLRDLVPGMKEYIETDPIARRYRPGNIATNMSDDTPDGTLNFAPIFKRLFCVAAQQLANTTHEPFEKLGVLFEEPLETGATQIVVQPKVLIGPRSTKDPKTSVDVEARHSASVTVARGKYFFLHRQVTKGEAARFASLGYRFANTGQITEPLAKSIQVSREELGPRLERMKTSASPERLLPPGTHLACFMVRPGVSNFDVLVPSSAQYHLPFVTMQDNDLTDDQLIQLRRFDDLNVSDILRVLVNQPVGSQIGEEIRWQLYNIFVKLIDVLGDCDTMMTARFSAKPFRIPCRNPEHSIPAPTCTLLTIRVLRNIHAASLKKDLTYVPLLFFSAQQHLQSEPKDSSFERKIRAEFQRPMQEESKDATSVSITKCGRANSTDSAVGGIESPRSGIFKMSKLSIMSSRRSDGSTVVEHEREKSLGDGSDIELTATSESAQEKHNRVSQCDVTNFKIAGDGWVSQVFALFRLGTEGWSNTPRGGWGRWDINIQSSFEVGSKNRGSTESRPFDAV